VPDAFVDSSDYWEDQGLHAASSELDAVCYPGAPRSLNRYADRSQRAAVEALLRIVGPLAGLRALDLGCGTGRWSRLLSARGADVLGVDRSRAMLAEAERRSPGVEFRRMGAVALDLADDAFHLATAVTVVQHLAYDDQARAARELVRVVRPGGHVLTIDRSGRRSEFSSAHGTYPRTRGDWLALWQDAGAVPLSIRGQEFSYPLQLARLGRSPSGGGGGGGLRALPQRRGGSGWRRAVLEALVAGSALTELVMRSVAPRAPAEHVAVLYRVV
jgi:SAM-dependent methyltransferase